MTNYYVDYDGGDDTNNGTSDATPFKHCPGDPSATDNADITLADGDTIYFKKGVTYLGEIRTNQNNITYTITTWGAGDATFDANGDDRSIFITHDDITITGVDSNRNMAFTGTPGSGNAAIQAATANTSGTTITYCEFVNITAGANRIGIKLGGSTYAHTNFEIAYNYFEDIPGYAIKISGQGGTGNGSIHHNEITDCGEQENAQVNVSDTEGVGITGISFYSNTIYTGKAADVNGVNFQDAVGSIYDNEIYDCYRGISFNPSATAGLVGILYIYKNKIHDNGYYGIECAGTGSSAHAVIYSNVIWDNTNTNIYLQNSPAGRYNEIYGNTIYHAGAAWGIYVRGGATYTKIKNNIIFSVGGGSSTSIRTETLTGFVSDYNLVYRTYDTDGFYYSTWRTLAEWQSDTSQDAHSYFADPLFQTIDTDFSLEAGSPARDKGVTLGSPYNIDYLGISRPQGTTYDIGAYEYYAGGGPNPDPVPPAEGPFAANLIGILSSLTIFCCLLSSWWKDISYTG